MSFVGFDGVVALDLASLRHAHEVGARGIAYVSDAWWDEPGASHGAAFLFRAYGEHDEGGTEAEEGAEAARESRCGPIAPAGFLPSEDKEEARRAQGLDASRPAILVAESAFISEGAQAVVLQLALVSPTPQLLLHVGRDVKLAKRLRELAPAHGVEAALLAETTESSALWALADLVVCGRDGEHIARGMAVHAPVLTFASGASEAAGPALRSVENSTMLAVAIDDALLPQSLSERAEAVRRLDAGGGAERLARAMLKWCAGQAEEALPEGLPRGLEPIGGASSPPESLAAGAGDSEQALETQVDEDLAALKARLKL